MGTVNTQVSPEIVKVSEDESESKCSLSWEINNEEDNDDISTYIIGSSYIARLYKGQDIKSVIVFNTGGRISRSGTGTAKKTEQITFTGEKESSLSYIFKGGLSYSIVGTAYNIEGTPIGPSFSVKPGSSILVASSSCFCVIEVTYTVKFDKYSFSSSEEGEALLVAVSTCGGKPIEATTSVTFEEESSSCCCSSCSKSSVRITSVTLVYKDFVTGKVIEGVSVSVDGSAKGSTNASGKITISGITTNETHLLKASKEGYLTTDSDSLANDSFIINT